MPGCFPWGRLLLATSSRTSSPDRPIHLSPLSSSPGGRDREVLGLELEDVSFDRRTVTFRPNRWRRLKTQGSWRVVPLWPQLEEILRAYLFGPRLDRGGPLSSPARAAGCSGRRGDSWVGSGDGLAGRPGRSDTESSVTPMRPAGSRRWTEVPLGAQGLCASGVCSPSL